MRRFRLIAIVGDAQLPEEALARLASYSAQPLRYAAAPREATGADALIMAWHTPLTQEDLAELPNLRYVGATSTTLAGFDRAALAGAGITLTNIRDYGDRAVAEFIMLHLLMLARGEGSAGWPQAPCELGGRTLGIIGLGAVGQAVAQAALGFGLKVRYFSPTRRPEWERRGVRFLPLSELLASSEVVTLHTPRDRQVLGAAELAQLQPGATLVHTTVGAAVDPEAFAAWIAHPHNRAIFDRSPGAEFCARFGDHPQVLFRDVVAGLTAESRQRRGQKVAENVRQFLASPLAKRADL